MARLSASRRRRCKPVRRAAVDRFALERMESRILFSADLASFGSGLAFEAEENRQESTITEPGVRAETVVDANDVQARIELVFVDAGAPDAEHFIELMEAGPGSGRFIYLIEAGVDGLEFISEIVSQHSGVDAIHIVSHGSDGVIQLGERSVDDAVLLDNAETVARWGEQLDAEADILLYGCDVAASGSGERFVMTLSDLTGADVAASDDTTGNRDDGGDWELEHASGQIDTATVANAQVLNDWDGVLSRVVYSEVQFSTKEVELKSSESAGQTFRHDSGIGAYLVNEIDLYLSKDTDATAQIITVSLRDTWNGTIFRQDTFNLSDIALGGGTVTARFTDFLLVDNTDYVVQIETTSTEGKVHVAYSNDNPFGGGTRLDKNGNIKSSDDLEFAVARLDASLTEVSHEATRDTYVDYELPTDNFGSSTQLRLDRENGKEKVVLLGFDTFSVPAGAVIESAHLDLQQNYGGSDLNVSIRNPTADWIESEATALAPSAAGSWAGQAYGATSYGEGYVSSEQISEIVSFDVTALAQAWQSGAVLNHGIALYSPDGGGSRIANFVPLDSGISQKPTLRIIYSMPQVDPTFNTPSALSNNEDDINVATIDADDANGDTLTYSLIGSDDDGLFSINSMTGALTMVTPDFEAPIDSDGDNVYELTVKVVDGMGGMATRGFQVTVTDVDEFDVTAPTDVDGSADTVTEGAAVGTTVGVTAQASDGDGSTNVVTYALSNDAGGRFAIDGTTGVVTVKTMNPADLDRETAASHTITVEATSQDGSSETTDVVIAVSDVDEFDVSAPTDADAAATCVAEGSAFGTTVGVTAQANDADATNNTVTYALTNDAGGRFAIDGTTGVVTVKTINPADLDRETAASHTITIQATSQDGSSETNDVVIAVSDVDEFDVSAPTDTDAAADTVAEGSAFGTKVGVIAQASDADATNSAVTYALTNDAGGRFAIDGSTGVVTVKTMNPADLDRETAASHTITVEATSQDGSSATTDLVILIEDSDEHGVTDPVDIDAAVDTIAEGSSFGSTVGVTAQANDADATNNTVTYALTNDAGGRFAIDATTGVVTVATLNPADLDRETAASHTITIQATSQDGSSEITDIIIAVSDVNESNIGQIEDIDLAADTVHRGAMTGTHAGIQALALDSDSTVTYSLVDDANARFAIDADSGEVTLSGVLDQEPDGVLSIVVRASSSDGSFADRRFDIALASTNEHEVSDLVDSNPAIDAVAEGAVVGSGVGITAQAFDLDANDVVSYTLDNDADGRFVIDATSGEISIARSLDHEAAASHEVLVRVESTDGSVARRLFAIEVSDVNESPELDTRTLNASPDTAGRIGFIAANDPDHGDSVRYALADTATSAFFSIDASSGELSVREDPPAGTYELLVILSDRHGKSAMQTLSVVLADDVHTPAVSSTPVSIVEPSETGGDVSNPGVPSLGAALPDDVIIDHIPTAIGVGGNDITLQAPGFARSDVVGEPDATSLMSSVDRHDEPSITSEPAEKVVDHVVVVSDAAFVVEDDDSVPVVNLSTNVQAVHGSNRQESESAVAAAQASLDFLIQKYDGSAASLTDQVDELFDEEFPELSLPPNMLDALRAMRSELDEVREGEIDQVFLTRAVGAAAGIALTASFVSWLFKSGLLAAATASVGAVWRDFDPIPVAAGPNGAAVAKRGSNDVGVRER